MVVGDKQTCHDSMSLCQKTWESSVSAHGPCQGGNGPPRSACMSFKVVVVDEDGRTEEA